jgi:16S rRNA (uracil1498-N3)-methyltransferase
MRSVRVHVDAELAVGADIALPQAQSHYLKHVLRLKPGALLQLFNGVDSFDYQAVLGADGKRLCASIEAASVVTTESPLRSEIIQGLGHADHMDWMIQKTTELGVSRISIFPSERTQAPLKSARLEKKRQHWRGVAISACEQCGRAILPAIHYHDNLAHALAACTSDLRLLLEFSGAPLPTALHAPRDSIAILLGPEGGLNPGEIELGKSAGFIPVSLGPRVLRTETAATSALAIAQALQGDLN